MYNLNTNTAVDFKGQLLWSLTSGIRWSWRSEKYVLLAVVVPHFCSTTCCSPHVWGTACSCACGPHSLGKAPERDAPKHRPCSVLLKPRQWSSHFHSLPRSIANLPQQGAELLSIAQLSQQGSESLWVCIQMSRGTAILTNVCLSTAGLLKPWLKDLAHVFDFCC